ncbi:MAG: HEPN domain-containing protein [Deltaproteobacteria bacterium]|nr:HEPN domain-containing protein [Deltaproteobacteria bacterium]
MKPPSKSEVLLRKAKGDEAVLDVIILNIAIPNEIYGFHAQQAAEKMIKSLLAHLKIPYKKIHNIRELTDLLGNHNHPLPPEFSELDRLTPFGTAARYDDGDFDFSIDRPATRETIRKLRTWVEAKLK